MSVVACYVPSWPLALLSRAEPDLVSRPLALLNSDDRVFDVSVPAQRSGVSVGQTVRQARVTCPDLEVRSVDLLSCEREFDALLALLDEYSDAVEPGSLEQAYLALPDLKDPDTVAVCQDIGRRVRREFGAALTPALGCNHSKFAAQAAAKRLRPGRMQVVQRTEQRSFLAPLSLRLLPLPDEQASRLAWLGIRRLGQYADLPARAVLQQFGPTGRTAHQWARGEDRRSVVPRQKRPVLTIADSFDPPLDAAPALLRAAARLLQPPLDRLSHAFQGMRRLHATRLYTNGQQETDTWTLPVPTADTQRLQRLLAARWQARAWDAPVAGLVLTLSELQDVWGEQYQLFLDAKPAPDIDTLLTHLRLRFGPQRVHQAAVSQPHDLRVERRVLWREASTYAVA